MAKPSRGQALHRNDSKIAWRDVKVILQILANKDRTRAGECDLIGDAIAAPVPFNYNWDPDGKLVVLGKPQNFGNSVCHSKVKLCPFATRNFT